MLILPFDTETTGLPNWQTPSGGDDQPHIVQLAAKAVDPVSRKVIQSMDVIIRPDGWTIPQEMTDIHGITQEQAMDVGIPESLALTMFIALWEKCDLRIAHNVNFDNRIIRIAIMRYLNSAMFHPAKDSNRAKFIIDSWAEKEDKYYCTMNKSRKIVGLGKPPTLEESYQHFYGKPVENAHSALGDTNACLDIYWALQDQQQ